MAHKHIYRILIFLSVMWMTVLTANAQNVRINFGTWAGSNISIQPVMGNTLSFGNLIKGGTSANTVTLTGATAFEITAPDGYDLTVIVDAPAVLTGPDETSTIPFSMKYAYSNQGYSLESQARTNAVEVTTGFTSVTFPVRRNALGLPAPPPNPLDGDNTTRPTAKAYLYLYGSAGPAGVAAESAGSYTGTINITVEYTQ